MIADTVVKILRRRKVKFHVKVSTFKKYFFSFDLKKKTASVLCKLGSVLTAEQDLQDVTETRKK